MAKYVVSVLESGNEHKFKVEAYSPTEAAFLAGAGLGAVVALTSPVLRLLGALATADEIEESMVEAIKEELSSVLVEEVRYADEH